MNVTPIRILIIDEDAGRAAVLEEGVGDVGTVQHIRDTDKLLPRVAAINPDVILIGLENTSRDALEQMLELARWACRPIAMFVDKSDADAAAAAIDAGVSAYIVDGLRRERVKSILDVTISRFQVFNRLRIERDEAKAAVEQRKLVEQAKSILMQQRGIAEPEAYALLRKTAMNENRKLIEIAKSLVAAASLLGVVSDD